MLMNIQDIYAYLWRRRSIIDSLHLICVLEHPQKASQPPTWVGPAGTRLLQVTSAKESSGGTCPIYVQWVPSFRLLQVLLWEK